MVGTILSPQILDGSSVLVTGATGLLGKSLLALLRDARNAGGPTVNVHVAVRNPASALKSLEGLVEPANIHHFDALEDKLELDARVDFIIHAASPAHPALYSSQPVEVAMANAMGTHAALRFASACGARLLYVSSGEVYGKGAGPNPIREDESLFVDTLDPRSCYPLSKRLAENLCAAHAREYGTDFVVVRPGHVYGPSLQASDTRAYAQFARAAARGQNIVMKSAGTQLRSWLYATDCASAILAVLTDGASGQAYNLADRRSVATIRELAFAFAKAGGVEVVFEDPTAAEAAGYNRVERSVLDATKLEQLGWRAVTDLSHGTELMVRALRGDGI